MKRSKFLEADQTMLRDGRVSDCNGDLNVRLEYTTDGVTGAYGVSEKIKGENIWSIFVKRND